MRNKFYYYKGFSIHLQLFYTMYIAALPAYVQSTISISNSVQVYYKISVDGYNLTRLQLF